MEEIHVCCLITPSILENSFYTLYCQHEVLTLNKVVC